MNVQHQNMLENFGLQFLQLQVIIFERCHENDKYYGLLLQIFQMCNYMNPSSWTKQGQKQAINDIIAM